MYNFIKFGLKDGLMPYKKIKLGEFHGIKLYRALLNLGRDMKTAQKECDKSRFTNSRGEILAKNDVLDGELFFMDYVCEPRGLEPIFECEEFAVFDKPSGLLSHPSGRNSPYNMYDEIWSKYGKNACVAHRLDMETSGVLVVAKNKNSAKELKKLFENRAVSKKYLAYVSGNIEPDLCEFRGEFTRFDAQKYSEFKNKLGFMNDFSGAVIDANMTSGGEFDDLKIKMRVCLDGKHAVTLIKFIKYFPEFNASLVECYPLTGRQHQIRLHLFHVQRKILGEPLYGLERKVVEDILDGKFSKEERVKLTGAPRLMLHSSEICFEFKGTKYNIKSKIGAEELYKSLSIHS